MHIMHIWEFLNFTKSPFGMRFSFVLSMFSFFGTSHGITFFICSQNIFVSTTRSFLTLSIVSGSIVMISESSSSLILVLHASRGLPFNITAHVPQMADLQDFLNV